MLLSSAEPTELSPGCSHSSPTSESQASGFNRSAACWVRQVAKSLWKVPSWASSEAASRRAATRAVSQRENRSSERIGKYNSGIRIRESIAIESDRAGSGIIEFDPRIVFAVVVNDSSRVVGFDFIDPNQRISFDRRGSDVWRARAGKAGSQADGVGGVKKTIVESGDVRAGEIPKAQRIRAGCNHARDDLRYAGNRDVETSWTGGN